jgi:hypothetical protein
MLAKSISVKPSEFGRTGAQGMESRPPEVGSTKARAAGAPIDDLKKLMGHAPDTAVTAEVYDMANLEAHRRIATARKGHRDKK